MNRAYLELERHAAAIDAEVEASERMAARRRWRPDYELLVLTTRALAAEARREMGR